MATQRRLPLVVSLLLVVLTLAVAGPALATYGKPATRLVLVSVTDDGSGLAGPVTGEAFAWQVRSVDAYGKTAPVAKPTTIALSVVTGTGTLSGAVTGTLAKGTSEVSVDGALYSTYGNGVVLRVSNTSGRLAPGDLTVTAYRYGTFELTRPGSEASLDTCTEATPAVPTCATVELPRGANGRLTLSEAACPAGTDCLTNGTSTALLVEALTNFKDAAGKPLYSRSAPASLVVACDKTLCGHGGVDKFPIKVAIADEPLQVAPPCPGKGRISSDPGTPPFCRDDVQSHRTKAGDLLTVVLFAIDLRAIH